MQTIRDISNFKSTANTVLTIGTFDGVHIGHVKILKRLQNKAEALGLKSAVMTFFPHPRMVLQKEKGIALLNTLEEKEAILEALGVDYFFVQPFTHEFSRLTALQFVRDLLLNQLNMKAIVIGYDHRFGRNRNANIQDLIQFGNTYGFEVEQIEAQEIDDIAVSSTKIRKALLAGEILRANGYLGYPYMLSGIVQRGKGLGRKLQFPTANISVQEPYKLLPKDGVYVISSTLDNLEVYGMMNIGKNPTVDGHGKHLEVHFFDLNENLYERRLTINFLKRLRDEIKFQNVEELQLQLQKDEQQARVFLKS